MPSEQLEMLVKMIRANATEEIPPIDEARSYFETMATMFPPVEDVKCMPVQAGDITAEWVIAPGVSHEHVILYLHGGGYTIGSINTHRGLASRISRAARARVLVIAYRLAPEHPYPAAVEDSVTSYGWLLSNGIQPERIVIAGDSAGGGLTVATLVALRDAGKPLPAAAVCLSPWVDLAGTSESLTTKAEIDPLVHREDIEIMAKAYLGNADARTPLASPLYANLSGLPPLLIQVGTSEVLLDDSARLAERAKAAGVDVVFERWDDMIHVWQYFATMLPEGQQAIDRIGEFIRGRTA